ncbi:MAG: hypothetical protein ACE5JH_02890 [Acidobacteriota bacterium]
MAHFPGGDPLVPLLSLAAAMLAGFAAMPLTSPAPGRTSSFLLLFLAVFIIYLLALRLARRAGPRLEGPPLRAAILAACLFRAVLAPFAPALSNDIDRYLWDGRVVAGGGNPYLHPPSAPELAARRDELYERLDHREVRTIYPPAAQLLFVVGFRLAAGVRGLKTLIVVADLLAIALLLRLIRRLRLPSRRILIYAWNPLAVVEVAWSGHLEPVGVLCALAAALAIIQKKRVVATLALTAGGLVKLLPAALFAPFLRSIRVRPLVLVPLAVAGAYWPFREAGAHLLSGPSEYARRWIANESIFGLVRAALEAIDPTPALKGVVSFLASRVPSGGLLEALYPYTYPDPLARAISAAAIAGVAVWIVRRDLHPLRGAYLLTGAILLLSPVLHPWYLLWLLPWLALFPSRPWILLSGLAALAYANLGAPGRAAEPCPWVRWIEYLPFYGGIALGWWRGRADARRTGRRAGDRSLTGRRPRRR